MPLAVRYVEPKGICKASLVADRRNVEFNTIAVLNMSGLIRQLASLAKHAESVMGDIADVLLSYRQRAESLEGRTRSLMERVLPSLDPELEGDCV